MAKKILIVAVAVCVILIGHFVPITKRAGYLDQGIQNLCIGYGSTEDFTIRLLPTGFLEYEDFTPSNDALRSSSSPDNPGCALPVKLKLYLL